MLSNTSYHQHHAYSGLGKVLGKQSKSQVGKKTTNQTKQNKTNQNKPTKTNQKKKSH